MSFFFFFQRFFPAFPHYSSLPLVSLSLLTWLMSYLAFPNKRFQLILSLDLFFSPLFLLFQFIFFAVSRFQFSVWILSLFLFQFYGAVLILASYHSSSL